MKKGRLCLMKFFPMLSGAVHFHTSRIDKLIYLKRFFHFLINFFPNLNGPKMDPQPCRL